MVMEIPQFRAQGRIDTGGAPPSVSPRANLPVAQGLAELAGTLEDIVTRRIEAEEEARQASELMALNSQALLRASELELSFQEDPDFRTAPQRFSQGLLRLGEDLATRTEDPDVRRVFELEFSKLATSKTIEMRRSSRKREIDATVSELDAMLPEFARQAAGANNDFERAQIRNQAEATIRSLAVGGFITRQDAVERMRQLGSDISEARARSLITLDPEAAALALLEGEQFPELDPVARSRLTDTAIKRADAVAAGRTRDAERAERREDRARTRRADDFMKEIFAQDDAGELTREFIEEARDDLSATQFNTALKLLDPDNAAVKDDRDTLLEVYTELGRDPLAGRALARQRFAAGLLSNETYKAIEGNAERFEDETFRAGKAFIERSLAPGDLIADPAQRQRAAQAVDEYRVWFQGADRTPEEAREQQQEIVRRFRLFSAGEPLLVPPQPRSGRIDFLGGDLEEIEAQIDQAEEAAVDAMAAGGLDPAVVQLEAQSLQRARQWLKQEKTRAEAARQERRKER